ncbi:hypothetical protein AAC387_Pa05g2625 [Persea americana]
MVHMKMAATKENFLSLISQYPVLLLLSFSYCCHANSKWTVRYLPGFNGPLPFHMETGYVGVGESDEAQLFYSFVKSETNHREDPPILWLTGGPGCAAWSGLVSESGLLLNPHSWTKIASIIFVDSPWLDDHPEFLSNPLYIGGDSYSGFILPIVVQEIANGIEDGQEPILNLKGYLLGNPLTDYRIDQNGAIQSEYKFLRSYYYMNYSDIVQMALHIRKVQTLYPFKYVGVGDLNEDQLFYFVVESRTNPKEDPLRMWITVGPGCSGQRLRTPSQG